MNSTTHLTPLPAASSLPRVRTTQGRAARRFWPSYSRREEIIGSTATYLAAFTICFFALGVGTYLYDIWALGLT